MKAEKMKKIAKVVQELGLMKKNEFTVSELDMISKRSGSAWREVMEYLRYWR